jgi:AmmeMemoRadiSam system protein B
MLRKPAVAGQFYPSDPVALTEMLTDFCPRQAHNTTPVGLMVPHAGYIYSGAIAGKVYDHVTIPNRIILLGPNHHGTGHSGAVYPSGSWRTPLGDIEIDASIAGDLLSATSYLKADTKAHLHEHSLEVQVPFIQHLNRQTSLVPICLAYQPLSQLLAIAEAISSIVSRSSEPISVIASTDMTHLETAQNALLKDRLAIYRVEEVDAEGLYRIVVEQNISMCGFMPTVVLLKVAKLLGETRSEIVVYGNSGDVTDDYSNVVAYAGALVGT